MYSSSNASKKEVIRCQERISCLADADIFSLLETFGENDLSIFRDHIGRLQMSHLDESAVIHALHLLLGESEFIELSSEEREVDNDFTDSWSYFEFIEGGSLDKSSCG